MGEEPKRNEDREDKLMIKDRGERVARCSKGKIIGSKDKGGGCWKHCQFAKDTI